MTHLMMPIVYVTFSISNLLLCLILHALARFHILLDTNDAPGPTVTVFSMLLGPVGTGMLLFFLFAVVFHWSISG